MNYNVKKMEDITNKRPQVLLIGNGVLQAKNGVSWDKLLRDISSKYKSDEKFWDIMKTNKDIPYSIKAYISTDTDDGQRREVYSEYLQKEYLKYYEENNLYIEKLLNVKCDTILTTNYTYEIENALCPEFYAFSDTKKRKLVNTTNKNTKKQDDATKIPKGMAEYYRFKHCSGYDKNIWHIHGETRKKSSLVLTHDEYGRLCRDILNVAQLNGNKYEKYKEKISINSWIDYFIIADIYIIGFGLDFSEFDIWWLLNRRLREKSGHGKIYFFEPYVDNELLNKVYDEFDIKLISLNYQKSSMRCEDYAIFYNKAIEEINKLMEENQK